MSPIFVFYTADPLLPWFSLRKRLQVNYKNKLRRIPCSKLDVRPFVICFLFFGLSFLSTVPLKRLLFTFVLYIFNFSACCSSFFLTGLCCNCCFSFSALVSIGDVPFGKGFTPFSDLRIDCWARL